MSTYLVCSNPIWGHFAPMLEIARHLSAGGHRVIMLTGTRFRERVEKAGVLFRPLGGVADYDDRYPDSYLPDGHRYSGIARAQYDIQTIFVRTLPDQHRALTEIVAAEKPKAILVDAAFIGVLPLLVDGGERPAVLAAGVMPLAQSSRDVAPHGMGMQPRSGVVGHLRNNGLNWFARRVLFRRTQLVGERMLAQVGTPATGQSVMEFSTLFDRFLQLSATEFEYPRSDLSPNTVFVGPVLPAAEAGSLPAWWGDLTDSRPVVHVTQGTIDNQDLGRLIRPTIDGLADTDVIVAVSTGGKPVESLGALPKNVRAAEFLPYGALLPLTDVMVTNAGYGGVQQALAHGVPLVAAGVTEDKPEVTARIAWSGVGIDLRTGTPTAQAVGDAVRTVLTDPSYRTRASAMAAAMVSYTPLETIERELETAVARP